MAPTLRGAAFILPFALGLLLLGTGCSRRSYCVELTPQEAIARGADVFLDGNKIGTVTEITQKNGTRVRTAKFVVTVPGVELRAGVEREQTGSMRLSSASCNPNAPVLQSGSPVPTRAPIPNIARTTVHSVRDFLFREYAKHPTAFVLMASISALLVVHILLRLIRKVLSCLLILAALTLALCPANGAPVKRQQVEAEISGLETLVTQAEDYVAQAKRLSKAGLLLPAQVAGVRALIACDRSAYAETQNLGNVDRLSAWTSSETRTAFRNRYHDANQRLAKVEDVVADVASTATNTSDRLVALYMAQREPIRNRIRECRLNDDQLLKDLSALAHFPASLIQQKLLNLDNASAVELDGPNIRLPNGQVLSIGTDSDLITKPTDVPRPPTIVTQFVTTTSQADLSRLETNTIKLSMQLGLLRQQQSNILSIIKTNRPLEAPPVTRQASVSPANPKLSKPASPLPPVRSKMVTADNKSHNTEQVPTTNDPTTAIPPHVGNITTTALTKPAIVVTSPASPPTPALLTATAATNNNSKRVSSAQTDSPRSTATLGQTERSPIRPKQVAMIVSGGALIIVLGLLVIVVLAAHARKRPMKTYLTDPAGQDHEVLLLGPDDTAILRTPPETVPSCLRGTDTAIGRDRFGRPVLLTNEEVTVNGLPVSGQRRVRPGDEIIICNPNGPATWILGGLSPLETPSLETELETVS